MLMKNLPSKNKFNIDRPNNLILLLKLLNIVSILRAHIVFYTSFRKFDNKEIKVIKKSDYFKHKSILYGYFVRGHAYFGDLKHKN